MKDNQNAFQRSCPWSIRNRKVVGFSLALNTSKQDTDAVCCNRGFMHLLAVLFSPGILSSPMLQPPSQLSPLGHTSRSCAQTAPIILVERVKKESTSQNVLFFPDFFFLFYRAIFIRRKEFTNDFLLSFFLLFFLIFPDFLILFLQWARMAFYPQGVKIHGF